MTTKDFNTATLTAKFVPFELTSTADLTVYPVPTSGCAKLQTLSACNRHSSAVTLDIQVVPNGQTANAKYKIISAISLAAGETVSFESIVEGMMLGEGDFVVCKASVANVVSIFLTSAQGA